MSPGANTSFGKQRSFTLTNTLNWACNGWLITGVGSNPNLVTFYWQTDVISFCTSTWVYFCASQFQHFLPPANNLMKTRYTRKASLVRIIVVNQNVSLSVFSPSKF